MALEALTSGKSESVYYHNLQFWLFFGTFLDLFVPGPIFSRSTPKKVDATYVARVLCTICVASKSL